MSKNALKKSIRRLQKKAHLEVFSASGERRKKVNPVVAVPTDEQAAAQLRQQLLLQHEYDLRQCASLLTVEGCWNYFARHIRTARIHKYEEELRTMVVEAALRFAGKSVRTINEAAST